MSDGQQIYIPAPDWTPRQREASRLLLGPAANVLLYGGSRSGKTRIIVEWLVRCCIVVDGLRVLILRFRRVHAKDTVWHETLLQEVLPKYAGGFVEHTGDLMISFPNGSEIWVGGTDDQIRLEKMLGRGAGLAYLNEVSQISYDAHTLVSTRLSQKLEYNERSHQPGRVWFPKVIGDCNPPSPTHWTHRIYIDHIEPRDNRELSTERYVAMRLNPVDNVPNLPAGYLESLDELPEQQRRRFRDGEFTLPTGAIFPEYGESLRINEVPVCEKYVVGIDLITYAAVLVGFQRYQNKRGDIRYRIYCVDEWSRPAALAHEAESAIESRWGSDYEFTKVIDHNLGKAGTREFLNSKLAKKPQGSVEAGIAQIQDAMHAGNFLVSRECPVLHYELENYRRDNLGAIVKEDDHHIAAVRMSVFSTVRIRKEIQAA